MPGTKRDLNKLGVTDLEQLDHPVPEGIIVTAKLALRKDDDGTQRNCVARFEVLRIEPPKPNPFPLLGVRSPSRRVIPNPPRSRMTTFRSDMSTPLGYRIVGPVFNRRHVVDHAAAFEAHWRD